MRSVRFIAECGKESCRPGPRRPVAQVVSVAFWSPSVAAAGAAKGLELLPRHAGAARLFADRLAIVGFEVAICAEEAISLFDNMAPDPAHSLGHFLGCYPRGLCASRRSNRFAKCGARRLLARVRPERP